MEFVSKTLCLGGLVVKPVRVFGMVRGRKKDGLRFRRPIALVAAVCDRRCVWIANVVYHRARPHLQRRGRRRGGCGRRSRRGGWGRGRAASATTCIHDEARDLIRTIEIRVACLITFHQTVKLAFADAVGDIHLVGQQIRRGLRVGFDLARLGELGVEGNDLGIELNQIGGSQRAGDGERGDVRIAFVVNGGAIGQAIRLSLVEQVGGAEIYRIKDLVFALSFGPGGYGTAGDGGGSAHGLAGNAFVLGGARGGADLFQFGGADIHDGIGQASAGAGKGGDGQPNDLVAV